MEQARKTKKARDLAIGFFGWLLIGFLVGFLISVLAEFSIWLALVTVVGIGLFFFIKRNWIAKRKWIAYGALAAVIINILTALIMSVLLSFFDWEPFIYSPFMPFFFWFLAGGFY